MNYFLWLEMVGTLSSAYANSNGKAPKELRYLNLLVNGAREGTLTDVKLTELHERIKAEKLAGTEPTDDDLAALEKRLTERSERIQIDASDVGSVDSVLGEKR